MFHHQSQLWLAPDLEDLCTNQCPLRTLDRVGGPRLCRQNIDHSSGFGLRCHDDSHPAPTAKQGYHGDSGCLKGAVINWRERETGRGTGDKGVSAGLPGSAMSCLISANCFRLPLWRGVGDTFFQSDAHRGLSSSGAEGGGMQKASSVCFIQHAFCLKACLRLLREGPAAGFHVPPSVMPLNIAPPTLGLPQVIFFRP